MKFARRRDLLAYVAMHGSIASKPFVLLDVGCRGGVHRVWKEFGPHLVAHGFDPAPGEAERLTAGEEHGGISYHPRVVGTAPATSLDDFVRDEGLDYVDFIKIDTDGGDLDVLRSSTDTLRSKGVLGLLVEAYFGGSHEPDSCTFHNIDRLLKEHGFVIFDLDVFRLADPALPLSRDREGVSTTILGKPRWADVLYCRVPTDPDDLALIKLACLAEMFRSPDLAASLVLRIPQGSALVDRDACLDLLTPVVDGERLSYVDYLARCAQDPEWLSPARRGVRGGMDLDAAMADLVKATRGCRGEDSSRRRASSHQPWSPASAGDDSAQGDGEETGDSGKEIAQLRKRNAKLLEKNQRLAAKLRHARSKLQARPGETRADRGQPISEGLPEEPAREPGITVQEAQGVARHRLLERLREDVPSFESLSVFEKISRIREWTYRRTAVSATRDHLLDDKYPTNDLSASELLRLFDANVGGCWCGGVATTLRKVYEELGFPAYTVDYGQPGLLTHVITLVLVDKELHAQDAYLNCEYTHAGRPIPFLRVLERLRNGEAVDVDNRAPLTRRPVHLPSLRTVDTSWMSKGQGITSGDCHVLADNHYVCLARQSVESFERNYFEVPLAYDFLESRGYPRDLSYLLLFPFAVHDPSGYHTDPAGCDLLRTIGRAAGSAGNGANECA